MALLVLILSTAISVSTILIQSSAIKYARPEKATIIYTLEPVAAAVLAYVLIGERLAGVRAFAGCALILFAIVVTVYRRRDSIRHCEGAKRLRQSHVPQKSWSTSDSRQPSEALGMGLHSEGSRSR